MFVRAKEGLATAPHNQCKNYRYCNDCAMFQTQWEVESYLWKRMIDQHDSDDQCEYADPNINSRGRKVSRSNHLINNGFIRRPCELSLEQRTYNEILKHVDVIFPVFLPSLAAANHQIPSPCENKSDTGNNQREILFVIQVLRTKNQKISAERSRYQGPKVCRSLPIEAYLKFSHIERYL